MTDYPPIAAVDLGSNSFHLLVAREVENDFQVLHREKQKIQLATGLDSENKLDQAAIDRAVAALKQFSETLKNFAPEQVKVVATYTLRQAANIEDVLDQAAEVFPYPIEVISGQEEARLIYQGVAHNLHHDDNRLIIDIGGGSTELIVGKQLTPLRLTSRNMGSTSFTKKFFKDGKITENAFKKAIIRAEQNIEPITSSFLRAGWESCLGTSGTVKSICAMTSEKFKSDTLDYEQLCWLKDELIAAEQMDALNIPGLQDDRKNNICGGVAVLLAAFKQLKIKSLSYCDFALREGLLHEMQDCLKHHDIRISTVDSYCKRFDIDRAHAELIQSTSRRLYQSAKKAWGLKNSEHLAILLWALELHEIGLSINSSGIHKHSAYIVENSLLPGFTQQQQRLLAGLIRFHRKKLRPEELPKLALISNQKLCYLLVIMRLSVLLNQKRQPDYLPKYDLETSSDSIHLEFPQEWLKEQPLLQADLEFEQEQLKKIGIKLSY